MSVLGKRERTAEEHGEYSKLKTFFKRLKGKDGSETVSLSYGSIVN